MPVTLEKFSLVPLLMIFLVGTIWFGARRAAQRNELEQPGWIYMLLLLVVLWGGVTLYFGLTGVYLSKVLLHAYPTFWLPFLPVVIVFTPILLFAGARRAVGQLIDATPQSWLIGIHALRILALGTLVKAYTGVFSPSFALWVGVPDLVFGISALIMMRVAERDNFGSATLAVWNLFGILVILPGAPLVAQMGLPGVFHSFDDTPSMITLFEFPMVLAPTLVVPIFVMMNMLVMFHNLSRARLL